MCNALNFKAIFVFLSSSTEIGGRCEMRKVPLSNVKSVDCKYLLQKKNLEICEIKFDSDGGEFAGVSRKHRPVLVSLFRMKFPRHSQFHLI